MKKIILASNNSHKAQEIQDILGTLVLKAGDFVDDFDPVEDGDSFEQNAIIKAKALFDSLDDNSKKAYMVLSDDSGLCVDELDGNPGIYSARYAANMDFSGDDTDAKNRARLKYELQKKGLKHSKGSFVCVMCLIDDEKIMTFEGVCAGVVGVEESGENGFGYDSMFFVDKKSLASMSKDEKNAISHRYKALLGVKKYLFDKK